MLVRYATTGDLVAWQSLAHLLLENQKNQNSEILLQYMIRKIENEEALVVYDMVINTCIGFLAFSKKNNRISWLGVNPRFRNLGVASALIEKALNLLDPIQEISVCLSIGSPDLCHAVESLFYKYQFKALSTVHDEKNLTILSFTLKPTEISTGPLLGEIHPDDFGLPCMVQENDQEVVRTIRAIIRNSAEEIALLYMKKDHYYKLPGVPFDSNIQTIEFSLYNRFQLQMKFQRVIGNILEYRDALDEIQMTCGIEFKLFKSEATDATDSYDVLWVPIESAIMLIGSNSRDKYMAKYVSKRDDIFLRSLL